MSDNAAIVDFLSASLKRLEADGRAVFTPNQQQQADLLAEYLDKELAKMVSELETVASCQQDRNAETSNGEPLPAFVAFCAGLRNIGETLLPHLFMEFRAFCEKQGVPYEPFLWVIRARADAFTNYLLQLARVHDVAFEPNETDGLAASKQLVSETLMLLEKDLRSLITTEMTA